MKKVLILSNHHVYTYNLRKEIIQKILYENYEVYLVLPYGEKVERLMEIGCKFIDLPLDRRGINPINDLKLLFSYYRIIKKIKPSVVLTYTIKPNVYGGFVCRILEIPYIANITGLGSAIEKRGLMKEIILNLYKISLKTATCVFFQNKENEQLFKKKKIVRGNYRLIPGSGVNLEHYHLMNYPLDDTINFLFIARVMKEKGIDQYLDAAKYIKEKYPNTVFHILGSCDEAYEDKLKVMQEKGIIQFHGMQSDVRNFHKISHCTIHPTYYPEGMSNVLLESLACGRPIITTDRSGCREVIDDGVNGFIVKQQDSQDLIKQILKFIGLPWEERKAMGLAGRAKVEREFNRNIVVDAYLDELKKVAGN